MSNERIEGSCLCGEVRFAVEPPTLWCAHCHCSLCQRAHGAGVITWVGVARGRFRHLPRGEASPALAWYTSSPGARRGFCATCGSTLFFESQRWPGEIHVVRANLRGKLDREPEAHVFYDSHVSWLELGDTLERKP